MKDLDEALKDAQDRAFQEPYCPFLLNKISILGASKSNLKASLKGQIELLVGAYISLATFIDDEDVLVMTEHSKLAKQVYRRVLKNMKKNSKEIKEFLKELAANTDALDP